MTTEATVVTRIPTIHLTEEDEVDAGGTEGNAVTTEDAAHLLVRDAGIAMTVTDGMIGTQTEGEEVVTTEETEMTIDVEIIDEITDDIEMIHPLTTGEGEVVKIAPRIIDERMTTQKKVGLFKVLGKD